MHRPPVFIVVVLWLLTTAGAVVLRAAITVEEVIAESSTTDAISYASTATFSQSASQVTVCVVGNLDADAADEPISLTWTTGGEAWTSIGTMLIIDEQARLTGYRYSGTHATSGVTASIHASDAQRGAAFRCYRLSGADTTTPVIQFKGAAVDNSLTASVTMDSARSLGSLLLASIMTDTASNDDCVFAAESGYTLGTATDMGGPSSQSSSQWVIGGGDTDPTFTMTVCSVATDSVLWAVEIATADGGGGEPPTETGTGRGGLLTLGVGTW